MANVENVFIESEIEMDFNVAIYDLLGRRLNIFTQKQFNKLVLNVSELKNGIYFVKLEGSKLIQSFKIGIYLAAYSQNVVNNSSKL
jgi:hypothetical protein